MLSIHTCDFKCTCLNCSHTGYKNPLPDYLTSPWLLDKFLPTPFPQHSMYYVDYFKTANRSCHLFSMLRRWLSHTYVFENLAFLFALPWTANSLFTSSLNCGTQNGQTTLHKQFSSIWAKNCFTFMHSSMFFSFSFRLPLHPFSTELHHSGFARLLSPIYLYYLVAIA